MRERLLRTIQAAVQLDKSAPPVVGIEEYFADNTQEDCLAPNQVGYGRPNLSEIFEALRAIESRDDVQAVVVGIHDEWTEALNHPDIWPAAECVHILTKASLSEVKKLTKVLRADGVVKGWAYGKHLASPTPKSGFQVFTVCWD